tara:strand:- start:214 stop:993 length:780 start_codon:yes stop_codon:yes gene_type:complete
MDNLLDEVKIKDAIDPQVFRYACDDTIEGIPEPLPNSIFRMACIGKSGSGKSNLIQALTQSTGKKRIYNRRFSNIFIVSPSVASQTNRPKLPEDRFYKSIKDLNEIFERIQNEDGMEGRTLIILDDLGSEIKKGGEETIILKKLFNNGRHIGRPIIDDETGEQIESGAVSVIVSAQKLTQLPTYLRHQLTHLAIFDCRNTKSELMTLYDEFFSTEKQIFNEILYRVFSKPFNFIFVNTQKSEVYNGFQSKFNILNKVYL